MLSEIGFVVWVGTRFKLHSDGNFEPLHSTLPTGDEHSKSPGEQAFSSVWFCTLHPVISMGKNEQRGKNNERN